jgi:hypothetical protein
LEIYYRANGSVEDDDEVIQIQMFQNALEFYKCIPCYERTELVVSIYDTIAELKLFIETGYSKVVVYEIH